MLLAAGRASCVSRNYEEDDAAANTYKQVFIKMSGGKVNIKNDIAL